MSEDAWQYTEEPVRGPLVVGFVTVAGRCPMGCGETLFLGKGGHVTCSWHACPNPCAADDLLSLTCAQAALPPPKDPQSEGSEASG